MYGQNNITPEISILPILSDVMNTIPERFVNVKFAGTPILLLRGKGDWTLITVPELAVWAILSRDIQWMSVCLRLCFDEYEASSTIKESLFLKMKTFFFLQPVLCTVIAMFLQTGRAAPIGGSMPETAPKHAIDRHALVTRHDVLLTQYDGERPLQVGNGEFAFGMDITGLQTFAPFNTMSHWGWHSGPLPAGQHVEDFQGQVWDTHGRPVRYPMEDPQRPELSSWLASSPHRLNLGRIGLALTKKDGSPAILSDLQNTQQKLDLWTGIVTSRFELEGQAVTVTTACDPVRDAVAVRIESPLVAAGRLAVFLECPGINPVQFANFVGDGSRPGRFERLFSPQQRRADFERRIDATVYRVSLAWTGDAELRQNPDRPTDKTSTRNRITLQPAAKSEIFSCVCAFAPQALPQKLPDTEMVFAACRQKWPAFWQSGGAIDLSESHDPRWHELERRIVLSQYLMAVNEAGSLPPQESGLVNNGWYGRFHMEMFWWHAAHWALWNRRPQLDRSLGIYTKLLAEAKQRAHGQGYLGARWPKCIGPDGREWPHPIHALLIWQQPHPIFFAELDYRAHPNRTTLERWKPVVEATADFLASYAFFDKQTGHYILGPPLHVVSENTDPKTTRNPTFELGYWRFGLRTAQEWRTRLGLPHRPEWERVLKGLSPLPEQDGVYVLHEGVQEMWTKFNFEHPALTGVFGMLPGDGVDKATMRRTLEKVSTTWNFNRTWGWDFPMLAMCAARLGETDRAVEFLLHPAPGFQFDARGLATGGPFPYFPSNGGLLYAVAMMAAGWDGAAHTHAPGFPDNGQWTVRWENLSPAP